MTYAVIVTSKKVKHGDGSACTNDGDKFWCTRYDTWDTSSEFHSYEEYVPCLKTFDKVEDAKTFAKKWRGHPWWCKPKSYEIVEVFPRYVQRGWQVEKPIDMRGMFDEKPG